MFNILIIQSPSGMKWTLTSNCYTTPLALRNATVPFTPFPIPLITIGVPIPSLPIKSSLTLACADTRARPPACASMRDVAT